MEMDQELKTQEPVEKKQESEENYPGKFIVDILKYCLSYKQFQYGTKKKMLN